jgi:hypothetical protein
MFSRLGLHIGGCFSAARRINIFRANLTPEVMLACLHRVALLDTTDRPRPRLRSGLPATRPALRYRPLRNIGSISTLSGALFVKPRIRGSMLQLPIMRASYIDRKIIAARRCRLTSESLRLPQAP